MGEEEVEMFGILMREVRVPLYCLMLLPQVTDLLCHGLDLSEKSRNPHLFTESASRL